MSAKSKFVLVFSFSAFIFFGGLACSAAAAPVQAPVTGEIERITIDNVNDTWSGGAIVVGGQSVIIPRNLLIDLPANRLTLKQLFAEAPAACVASGETGLARGDRCNTSKTGGFATIAANITNGGNIIAGDVLIEKGREVVSGLITFMNYTDGYLRVNGVIGDANKGVMVRINDPTGRHTVQQGLGCLPGSLNCSPDPRFTVDPDNYVVAFATGFPACIPSTVPRTFVDLLGLGVTVAQSTPTGTGDVLCPDTNRSINGGQPVDDSRRFAPIQLGDHISATGNVETINSVSFVSVHTLKVSKALATKNLATQPDYLFINQALIEAPGFQDQKIQALYSGSTTRAPADVVVWSVHNDPLANQGHEFFLATTLGCDAAAGVGSCTSKAVLPTAGIDIFSISHIVDFRFLPTERLFDPCAHLRADVRFIPLNICPAGGTFAEQFSILSPLPRQILARTGQKLSNPGLITLDVRGNQATNGQYYFQMGIGLGSIQIPDFLGINLNLVFTPFIFEGIPWNNDRRLSPVGCSGPCEATPQPLSPFPASGLDPRIQAATPTGPYIDPNYNNGILTVTNNRVLSYVKGTPVGGKFNFDGNNTILAWPPVDPAPLPIPVVSPISFGAVINDFDGDGRTDIAIYRANTGIWWIIPSSTGVPYGVGWGGPSDVPVPGDYDGDGKTDVAIYEGTTGAWWVVPSSGAAAYGVGWGGPGFTPVPGDYDGDGKTDVAIYEGSTGVWWVIPSSGTGAYGMGWGGDPSDIPL